MKLPLILALFFSSFLISAQTFNNPESVEFDASNNRYFVSSTNNNSIFTLAQGESPVLFKNAISPAPYGLEIVNGILYACCGSSIKGFNIQTAEQVFNLNVGAAFLNGITHDSNGLIYATDFTNKRIYQIDPIASTYLILAENLVQSPNGIWMDEENNRLIFVNWGSNAPVKMLDLSNNSVSNIINTNLSNCDGIAKDSQGRFYISNWGNSSVVRFNNDFSEAYETVVTGLNKPADIYFNQETGFLAIPNGGFNTVSFHDFNDVVEVVIAPCNELPLVILSDSIRFVESLFVQADGAIRMPILNSSLYNYAYPLAEFRFPNGLPSGMTVFGNSNFFEVFASSWNIGDTAMAFCSFQMVEEVPINTMLDFSVRITNLTPSAIDTCYFEQTFSVNLKPFTEDTITTSTSNLNQLELNIYPNPASDRIVLKNIHLGTAYRILDVSGKLVLSGNYIADFIALEGLKQGFYFIETFDYRNRKQGRAKFLIQ